MIPKETGTVFEEFSDNLFLSSPDIYAVFKVETYAINLAGRTIFSWSNEYWYVDSFDAIKCTFCVPSSGVIYVLRHQGIKDIGKADECVVRGSSLGDNVAWNEIRINNDMI